MTQGYKREAARVGDRKCPADVETPHQRAISRLETLARSHVSERSSAVACTVLKTFWMCSKTVHRALVGDYRHAWLRLPEM